MRVHRLSMVMAMNVRQRHKKLRVRRKAALPRYPLPPLLAAGMTAGYLIGCCCGANAVLTDSSGPVLSFLQSGGAGDTLYGGLLPELCISCAYGFAFLLLSTSYLGFLLIPVVFGVKGFLSACTAAAFLRSGCAHAFAPVVCCGWFARRVSRAGAVFARCALRADVCASDGAAAWPAVSCCDGALFPGTGVGVLPAACGCGHGELCRAVFHKAYSVTDGHSG